MSRRLEDLDVIVQLKCRAFLAECLKRKADLNGLDVIVTHTRRTMEEQGALYAKGRSVPGNVVTNAKPGYSWHNFGRAFDVAFMDARGKLTWDGPWAVIGDIGKSLGLEWGGDFTTINDRPHFQWRNGLTLSQARKKAGITG